jgi:hypothetical protein
VMPVGPQADPAAAARSATTSATTSPAPQGGELAPTARGSVTRDRCGPLVGQPIPLSVRRGTQELTVAVPVRPEPVRPEPVRLEPGRAEAPERRLRLGTPTPVPLHLDYF